MKTILIADPGKASLVMSSEVFKDKLPGATILVAKTGEEALNLLGQNKPDMCVVDFDLPDADGVSLITAMRKTYQGPILLTAYPEKGIDEAVAADLFAFNDAGAWVKKPVRFEHLATLIDEFLISNHRLERRFDTNYAANMVGKAAGKGKRPVKVVGKVINLSLSGACVKLDTKHPGLGVNQELNLLLALPAEPAKTPTLAKKTAKSSKKPAKGAKPAAPKIKYVEHKLKASVAWTQGSGKLTGLRFDKLTETQKKTLSLLLKRASDLNTTRPDSKEGGEKVKP